MSWKNFFYFTQSERQGIILLIVLITLVAMGSLFIPQRKATVTAADNHFEKEYTAFKNSLQKQEEDRQSRYNKTTHERTISLHTFDPNTLDSMGFINLGLPNWMAKNILRYRAKGGTYRQPEDFRKVYGLTEQQYAALAPYIAIPKPIKEEKQLYIKPQQDSLFIEKLPMGTVLSLNTADTTELKKIPGIGSAIARMIVNYRNLLGGFHTLDQLSEIHLNVDYLRPWFSVKEKEIKSLNLNKISIEALKRHPYFNFYQAKVIVEYRKKKGKLVSLEQLKFYDEFTPEDLIRMAPYVSF